MRSVALAILLPLLISQSAFAAQQQQPVLAPGKPAGISRAQEQETMVPLAVFGAAAVGIGIALAVSDDGNGGAPTTTTTTGTAP